MQYTKLLIGKDQTPESSYNNC